jgi:hypothetical protein
MQRLLDNFQASRVSSKSCKAMSRMSSNSLHWTAWDFMGLHGTGLRLQALDISGSRIFSMQQLLHFFQASRCAPNHVNRCREWVPTLCMGLHGITWDCIEVTSARYLGMLLKWNFLNATAVGPFPWIMICSPSCKAMWRTCSNSLHGIAWDSTGLHWSYRRRIFSMQQLLCEKRNVSIQATMVLGPNRRCVGQGTITIFENANAKIPPVGDCSETSKRWCGRRTNGARWNNDPFRISTEFSIFIVFH